MSGEKRCIDCAAAGRPLTRPAPHPGPRCATDWRAKKNERKQAARARRWEAVYSISADQYQAIYEAQNGRCFICRRSRGLSRALAVDHDHKCCPGPTSCGQCVRQLLCVTCNQFLGHIGDSVEAAERIIEGLTDPIAQRVLTNWEDFEPPED